MRLREDLRQSMWCKTQKDPEQGKQGRMLKWSSAHSPAGRFAFERIFCGPSSVLKLTSLQNCGAGAKAWHFTQTACKAITAGDNKVILQPSSLALLALSLQLVHSATHLQCVCTGRQQ